MMKTITKLLGTCLILGCGSAYGTPGWQGQQPTYQGQPDQGQSEQNDQSEAQPQTQPQPQQANGDHSASANACPQQEAQVDQDRGQDMSSRGGPRLGILVEPLTSGLRSYFRVPQDRGVLVAEVLPGSPAARAGLQVGDVLTSIDRESVRTGEDVVDALAAQQRSHVKLDVVRGGQSFQLTAHIHGQVADRERGMEHQGQNHNHDQDQNQL